MFDKLAEAIHDVGEPTIAFSDRINEANTIPQNELQTISVAVKWHFLIMKDL